MTETSQHSARKYLKILQELEFNFVFDKCPVQVLKGQTALDIETKTLYLSISFLNVSDNPITSLETQIFFYGKDNLPYEKLKHLYNLHDTPDSVYISGKKDKKQHTRANKNDIFADCYYIKLSDRYFKRIDIGISKIFFADGTSENYINMARHDCQSFNKLNIEEVSAYQSINIYSKTEKEHPAKIVPVLGDLTWVCCCGEKNSNTNKKCSLCKRERDWQLENITVENLNKIVDRINNSDETKKFHANEIRSQTLQNMTSNQREKKVREEDAAFHRANEQLKKSDRRKKHALTIVLLWIVSIGIYIIVSTLIKRLG